MSKLTITTLVLTLVVCTLNVTSNAEADNVIIVPVPTPPLVVNVCPEHYVPLFDIISHQVISCVPMPQSQW